ncbi:MAG: hypothetical protein ACREKQ_11885 [Candidatus Rokuibacteriota bacterium]
MAPDPLAGDDDELVERRVVPFREAVAMALDDRIAEFVSKLALLATTLRLHVRPWRLRRGWVALGSSTGGAGGGGGALPGAR